MGSTIGRELTAIKDFLRHNAQPAAVILLSTLFLILNDYHSFDGEILNHIIFFFVLPVFSALIFLRRNPLDFGLRPGKWRIWIVHVTIACALCVLLVFAGSRIPAVMKYYGKLEGDLASYAATRLIRIFALEFMFRGFILFGLKEKYGDGAIFIQMIPFAILHIGKPEIETIGCILSGTYFGYIALRTGSVWPAFLIHYFVNIAIVWVAI